MHNRDINPGQIMRERALAIAMRRKEEYLGARVPKELRDRVIKRAEELNIPASTLIRNILEEAVGGASPAAAFAGTIAAKPRKVSFPSVWGWEELRLNRAAQCSGCEVSLEIGSQVAFGITGGSDGPVVLCGQCKEHVWKGRDTGG